MPYSSDEVLSRITTFYQLLTRLHLPSTAIKHPPPTGWPWPASITFSPAKTATVQDLMKHMPYLQAPKSWEHLQIYEKTEAVDYSTFDGPGPHNVDPEIMYTTLPAHVLMMGFAAGRDGHFVFLDTERGTWTVCDFQVGAKGGTGLSQSLEDVENPVVRVDEAGNECTENWREYATFTTEEFFAKLMREFEELVLVPYPNGEVHFAGGSKGAEDWEDDEVRAIYRKHGWPGEGYRKEECLKDVEECA
jgi:hypothetical protein